MSRLVIHEYNGLIRLNDSVTVPFDSIESIVLHSTNNGFTVTLLSGKLHHVSCASSEVAQKQLDNVLREISRCYLG